MRARFIATTVGTVLTVGVLTIGSTATADERAAVAVVVGQTGTPAQCGPANTTWVQYATPAAPTYAVPGGGVITSVSHNANATPGAIRAVIVGPAAAPNSRTVLGYSAPLPVTPNTLNTFAVRLPVPAGSVLGLHISANSMGCLFNTAAAGDVLAGAVFDPSVASVFTPMGTYPSRRLNLSAVWEPDADGDQYGDVSQDLCPQSAQTQLACPAPDTTITKPPAKRSAKRQAKIKFTSAPGARFTCAVDDKPAKPCASPFKKRYQVGKHVVVVTAVSNFGIVDPSPAKVKFRIVEQV